MKAQFISISDSPKFLKYICFKKNVPRRDFFKKRHTTGLFYLDVLKEKKVEGHRISKGDKG